MPKSGLSGWAGSQTGVGTSRLEKPPREPVPPFLVRGEHIPGRVARREEEGIAAFGQRQAEVHGFLDAPGAGDSAGVTGDHVTFTLCQSGVRAADTWFVLTDLLGYDDVRMYDGSWVEYGNREDSPIAN